MKTCVIVDDEFLAIKILKNHIAQRNDIVCVNSFTKSKEAIAYLKENPIDILFLDIEMPVSGLKVKKQIPAETVIIFTTGSPQYALEAFNQDAADYVLKPIFPDRFNHAIDKAMAVLNARAITNPNVLSTVKDIITIKSNKKVYKIPADDLVYIESFSEYVCYVTKTEKITTIDALKVIIETLPSNDFIRIHKSFIVNKKHIAKYTASIVTLNTGEVFNIGRMWRNEFREKMG